MFLLNIVDDRIIYSWCLIILNIQFNVFYLFDVLIKNLGGLSTSYPNKYFVNGRRSLEILSSLKNDSRFKNRCQMKILHLNEGVDDILSVIIEKFL